MDIEILNTFGERNQYVESENYLPLYTADSLNNFSVDYWHLFVKILNGDYTKDNRITCNIGYCLSTPHHEGIKKGFINSEIAKETVPQFGFLNDNSDNNNYLFSIDRVQLWKIVSIDKTNNEFQFELEKV